MDWQRSSFGPHERGLPQSTGATGLEGAEAGHVGLNGNACRVAGFGTNLICRRDGLGIRSFIILEVELFANGK